VYETLTEIGPLGESGDNEDGPCEEFAQRLRSAGGDFDTTDPGRLLDVLTEAR
jgi:glucose-6-phosphate 1-dehydrogenase